MLSKWSGDFVARQSSRQRVQNLFASDSRFRAKKDVELLHDDVGNLDGFFGQQLYEAKSKLTSAQLLILSLGFAVLSAYLAMPFVHPFFVFIIFCFVFSLPYMLVVRQAEARATEFAEDFPNLLLATASSLKAGMTVYAALERAIRILPADRIVHVEVQDFLSNISKGISREQAVARFADSIRRPDIALFRTAFLLVLQSGGRFAPTLERLALVSRDRSTLVRTAAVRCSSMKMTANILLGLTPLIVFMVAVRTENYLQILQENALANLLATIGICTILLSYGLLRRMSAFRP